MAKFISNLTGVGFAIEAVRGTGEASADFFVKPTSISVNDVVEKVVDEASIGVLAEGIDDATVLKKSEASVEVKVTDKMVGQFLKVGLGSVATTGPVTDVYTHVFDFQNDSIHPTMTLFKYDPVQSYSYDYGVMTSLEFSAQLGQYLLMTPEFTAKAGVEATVTPAYTSENAFLPQHMEVKFADTQAGLTGATAICADSVSLTIDKGMITDQCLGSDEYIDLHNGVIKVTGSIEMSYQDKTQHDKLTSDAVQAIRIKAVNSGVIIGSGSDNPEIEIDIHRAKIQVANTEYSAGELAKQTIEFTGYYDMTASKLVTITVKNEQVSY
ncbi:MAG: hypothetical protein KAT71_08030 [Gammaproteobacteria bacterium]|nr:hypothetical protein [Gammaproteobacteria bacterium]